MKLLVKTFNLFEVHCHMFFCVIRWGCICLCYMLVSLSLSSTDVLLCNWVDKVSLHLHMTKKNAFQIICRFYNLFLFFHSTLYDFYHYFYMMTNVLFYVSSVINPILYNLVSSNYRQVFFSTVTYFCYMHSKSQRTNESKRSLQLPQHLHSSLVTPRNSQQTLCPKVIMETMYWCLFILDYNMYCVLLFSSISAEGKQRMCRKAMYELQEFWLWKPYYWIFNITLFLLTFKFSVF